MAGVNLFDLAAKISVDTAGSDRALTENQKRVLALAKQYEHLSTTATKATEKTAQSTSGLRDALKTLGSSAVVAEGPLGGVAGRLQGLQALSGSAALPIAALGLAFVVNAKAAYELHQALFNLATETAAWQGALTDLSQQTGVTVETLSAFEILTRQTGGSLDSIAASLGIFQKNLEAALDPTSKQAAVLTELGVNTLETEAALRQTMAALAKMPTGFHQTALALELFGRGGKQMLAILKETHGDLDSAMASFRAMGLEVSGPTSAAADKLNDKMVILDAQVRALKAALGNMITPQVLSTVEGLTNLINENQQSINQLAFAVGVLAAYLGSNLVASIQFASASLAVFQAQIAPLVSVMQVLGGLGGLTGNIPAQNSTMIGIDDVGASGSVGGGIFRPKKVGNRGGGGKGGAGAKKAAPRDAGLELLKQMEGQYDNLISKTELERVNLQLQGKEYANLNPQVADHIRLIASLMDTKKESDDLEKKLKQKLEEEDRVRQQVIKGIVTQENAIRDLLTVTPEWKRSALSFIESLRAQGFAWADNTDQVYLARAAYLNFLEAMQRVREEQMKSASDLAAQFKKEDQDKADKAAKDAQDRIDRYTDKLRQLAGGLTHTIDNAISTGFERGIKAGLISFAQGILQMIQSAAMQALEKKLFDIFSNAGGAGGGGGWLGKLLGIVVGVAGGAAGGGSAGGDIGGGIGGMAGGIPHAAGLSYVPFDNYPALLHKGERVVPAAQNNGQMGSVTHVHNWYVSTPNAQSFMSGPTQHQIMQQLNHAASKVALMG